MCSATSFRVSKTYDGIELADTYAIQGMWLQKRLGKGARMIGRKIGLTSRAMQMASNFNEPDYGSLTDDMRYADSAQVEAARYLTPRLEVELAFGF